MMFIRVELCVVVECLLAKKLICVVGVVGLCRRVVHGCLPKC